LPGESARTSRGTRGRSGSARLPISVDDMCYIFEKWGNGSRDATMIVIVKKEEKIKMVKAYVKKSLGACY